MVISPIAPYTIHDGAPRFGATSRRPGCVGSGRALSSGGAGFVTALTRNRGRSSDEENHANDGANLEAQIPATPEALLFYVRGDLRDVL